MSAASVPDNSISKNSEDGESLAESFADLLNSIHISGNKSPRALKSCLPFAQYCTDFSVGHPSSGRLRRRDVFYNTPSTNSMLGGPTPSRRSVSTMELENSSGGPAQRRRPASFADGTMNYAVSTKEYDGCRPSTSGDRAQKIPAMDQVLQSRFEAGAHVKIADLPFQQGSYTGVIDRKARPYGKGTWVSGNENFSGWWYKGV